MFLFFVLKRRYSLVSFIGKINQDTNYVNSIFCFTTSFTLFLINVVLKKVTVVDSFIKFASKGCKTIDL